MKPEHILHGLQTVKDEYLLEAKSPTRTKKRRTRWGIILAACLCLILVGTAFAVDEFYDLSSMLFPSEDGPTYEVTGTVAQYPLELFSDELLAASESRGTLAVVQREFDTWEEVRTFIGTSIDLVWPNAEDWEGRYYVYLFHTGSDRLWGVSVESVDLNAQASASLELYTEHHMNEGRVTKTTHYNSEDTLEQLEPYTTANGLPAELVLVRGTETHPDLRCIGTFTRAGVIYSAKAYGNLATQEETVLRLHALLDSFG